MNGTILIADDDIALVEAIAMRCESMGLETIVVDNAECARLAIACEQPDLAILDLNMPKANEGDVLELLASDSELSELPVIILTGRKDRLTRERCDNLGVYYVAKEANVWLRLKTIIQEILTVLPVNQQ